MADIATVFHWPPSAFDRMTIGQLMSWRAAAIERLPILLARS